MKIPNWSDLSYHDQDAVCMQLQNFSVSGEIQRRWAQRHWECIQAMLEKYNAPVK